MRVYVYVRMSEIGIQTQEERETHRGGNDRRREGGVEREGENTTQREIERRDLRYPS